MSLLRRIKNGDIAGLESYQSNNIDAMAELTISGLEAEVAALESLTELNEVQKEEALVNELGYHLNAIETKQAAILNVSYDGLTQREATYIGMEMNNHMQRLVGEDFQMPSLESFGNRMQQSRMTDIVANESVSDTARDIWKWIIDLLKKIKDMFASWWDKFFGAVEKLKKFAQSVKNKASSYKDDKDNKKITIKGVSLFKGKARPTTSGLRGDINNLVKTVDSYILKQSNIAEGACDAITNYLTSIDDTEEKLKTAYAKFIADNDVKSFASGVSVGNKIGEISAKAEAKDNDGLIGGKKIVFGEVEAANENDPTDQNTTDNTNNTTDNTNNTTDNTDTATAKRTGVLERFAKSSYKVEKGEQPSSKDSSIEIDRIAKADVEAIAMDVLEAAEEILNTRKSRQDARKYADDLMKAVADVKKTFETDDGKKFKREGAALGKCATEALKEVAGGSVAGWTAHIVTVCNAALKACSASI